jgi:hypothetical protein
LLDRRGLVVYCGGSAATVLSGGAPVIPNRRTVIDLVETLKWEKVPEVYDGNVEKLVKTLLS